MAGAEAASEEEEAGVNWGRSIYLPGRKSAATLTGLNAMSTYGDLSRSALDVIELDNSRRENLRVGLI